MLTKINGVLMSAAPGEGAEGGGGSAAAEGAPADNGAEGGEGDEEPSGGASLPNASSDEEGGEDNFGEGFDLDAFLAYDPMKASDELRGKKAQGEGEEKDPAPAEGKDPAKPAEAKKEPEPGQKEKESPEIKLLQEQVKQLTQLLNQTQQQAQQQGDEGKQQEQTAAKEKTPEQRHQEILQSLPKYDFKIPADVMQKFQSEDANVVQQGLAEYASGIAQVTHYNLLAQVRQEMDALREELLKESVKEFRTVSKAEAEETAQRDTISKDFYGKFPELDKPELKLFIQTQAKQLAQQYGVQQWNENFRDTLGQHVKKVLGLGGQGPQPDETQSKKKAPAGQRFNSGSGAGRSKPSGKADQLSDISDTLEL